MRGAFTVTAWSECREAVATCKPAFLALGACPGAQNMGNGHETSGWEFNPARFKACHRLLAMQAI